MFDRLTIVPKTIITNSWSHLVARNSTDSCCAPLMSTLSTDGWPLSSRVRCGLDMTMTPSVLQSSGCCLRLRSTFPHPSFPCSSIMSRSCELLLFTMTGPILRRNIASLNIGCTLEVSLVRRITFFSFFVFAQSVIKSVFFCIIHWLHKHDRPGAVTSTAMSIQASRGVRKHPFGKAFDISHK